MEKFFFLLLFFPTLILSLPFPPSSPSRSLLQKICNATTDYSFCISSLSSSPSSSNATIISSILINLSISNSTNTSIFALSLSKSPTIPPPLSPLLLKCSDKYVLATEALRSSLEEVIKERYDYTWARVYYAKDYSRACRSSFGKSTYPEEMRRREEVFLKLCDVIMDVLNLLIDWS